MNILKTIFTKAAKINESHSSTKTDSEDIFITTLKIKKIPKDYSYRKKREELKKKYSIKAIGEGEYH